MSEAALREPWESLHRQRQAASFGIWVFLASEVLFFGGLLLAYAAYRHFYPEAFAAAARETNVVFGTVNTVILLTSSLTMAAASEGAAARLRRLTLWGLGLTLALGLGFLVTKGFEYREDIERSLVPGAGFAVRQVGAPIFFAFYWVLTSVHAVHLSIGLGVITVMLVQVGRRHRPLSSPALEIVALYWHLVDLVWIFLYPLLYLVGRS